jgi:hypothetical protein
VGSPAFPGPLRHAGALVRSAKSGASSAIFAPESSYEEDAYQNGGINIHVPARVFFEGERRLRWDGLSGYRDREGRLRFLDPSAAEPGSPALVVDRSYLLDFMRRHELAVVWSVLGEKIFIGGHADAFPRLEFSRAYLLDQSGILRSSELVIPSR